MPVENSDADFVQRHVTQSLSELSDPKKFNRWKNGERAKEQAAQIVSELLLAAIEKLDQQGSGDASQ